MNIMDNLEQQFLNTENFYLAFKRLNYYLLQSNEWYDSIELSNYEANLETNLYKLRTKIKEGNYSTNSIEPLSFPKKNNSSNEEQIRPYYKIHIEDQLVWIAIVNVIGVFMEPKMPFWSYGNRLFQPMWFDENQKLIKGSYKNSSPQLYRKWNQSWPFYRRHISMTIKTMGSKSNFKLEDLDSEVEKKIYKDEESSNFNTYKYLDIKFWKGRNDKKLYWIGLDFKKFFPSINPDIVLNNIKKYIVRGDGTPRDDTKLIFETIEKLLQFPINTKGWNEKILLDENLCGLKNTKELHGIPTGLLVSGFLANVAMLDLDAQLDKYIEKNRKIALFKFVDDQIILTSSKKEMLTFLNFYKENLSTSNIGVEFQEEKTSPTEAYTYNVKGEFIFADKTSKNYTYPVLDINFPEPLMTHTLQKMSALNDEDYELLDNEEVDKTFSDLKHFLLADFPDSEMKRETRMAYASLKLCLLSKQITPNFRKLDMNTEENIRIYQQNCKLKISEKKYKKELEKVKNKYFNNLLSIELSKVNKKYNDIFILLIKAVTENPDKLKLWKRLIEFCYYTGFDGLNKILQTIDRVNIHDLSKDYLKSYFLLLIEEKIIFSFNQINNANISFWKNETSSNFIKNISKIKIQSFSYLDDSLKKINLILGILKLEATLVKDDNDFNFESFLWYILNNTSNTYKVNLWENYINKINFENPISWSLIRLYPSKIPESILVKIKDIKQKVENMSDLIFENFDFRNKHNGIIYEMFENRLDLLKKYSDSYPDISKVLNHNYKTHIPLNLWLKAVLLKSEKNSWVDIRLFEWSILEIIKQIGKALTVENDKNTIFYQSKRFSFHPSNYLIPIEWINQDSLNWRKWKSITEKQKIILNNEKLIINDTRYFPAEKEWGNNQLNYFFGNGDITLILELSTLMIKLLSKNLEWSNYINKIKFIDQYFSEVTNILETVPVSSDTRLLLSNIFSKSYSIDYLSKTAFDLENGLTLNSIDDFNIQLSTIQDKLEKNHLELLDSTPRQLTIIDIDLLNESKKIY